MAAVILQRQRQRRKRRNFKERVVTIDHLTEQEVISRYRLDKRQLQSWRASVLIGLRFLAKGDFLSEVADLHGVSKATAATVVDEFINSVNLRLRNIRFPTDRIELNEIKRKFYQKCRMPNIIGAVDGTLIPIQAPTEDEAAYVCRKNYHALNVQAVCDPDARFTDVVAMWPGSQHDAAIFNSCGLKNHLELNDIGMLLGDSGYPLKKYLLTPKLNPSTPQEVEFNKYHSRGRIVIEKAFGLLKSRFRCLHRTGGVLQFRPGKCSQVVLACMRLHNLCVSRNVPEPPAVAADDDNAPYTCINNQGGVEDRHIRQAIINLF
ncbi:putative nuclease HARBI1 [Mercenaria mercenaria]|uniref:putative nuclease HARBI1 n=1 Tax=Mercenaria mercenaria TaxID=6596 RepID=UPI00234E487F|nr:putative nuclease HARBI1 [Mercenaria mercenaria]